MLKKSILFAMASLLILSAAAAFAAIVARGRILALGIEVGLVVRRAHIKAAGDTGVGKRQAAHDGARRALGI